MFQKLVFTIVIEDLKRCQNVLHKLIESKLPNWPNFNV